MNRPVIQRPAITSQVLLNYLDDPRFQRPDTIDEKEWAAAIKRIRSVLKGQLKDLALPVNKKRRIKMDVEGTVCKPIRERLREKRIRLPETEAKEAICRQLRNWLQIRLRVTGQRGFSELIQMLQKRRGKIDQSDIKNNPRTRTLYYAIHNAVRVFLQASSPDPEQKELAWDLLEEFLARTAGLPEVHLDGRKTARGGTEVRKKESELKNPISSLEELYELARQKRKGEKPCWVFALVTQENRGQLIATRSVPKDCKEGQLVSFIIRTQGGSQKRVILEARILGSRPFAVTTDDEVRRLGLAREAIFKT